MKTDKITIKDVARMAGVSKGTVDRVVHNRGEVSPQSKAKVLEIIEQIGYKPNLYASLLASKKRYVVMCLIPQVMPGEYWELVYNGIARAVESGKTYNVEVGVIFYDQFDLSSFQQGCAKLLKSECHAAMLAPIYKDATISLTAELNARGIPFVYIDSKLEGTNYLAYYGMPMFQSGYLGASLLLDGQSVSCIANFRIDRGASPQDNPTLHRREGFLKYLSEHNPSCEVLNAFIKPFDPLHNLKVLDAFFEQNPNVKHIVTFNSRVHLIAEYLEKRGIRDCRVLGFDMLSKNIKALENGYVKFLIAQRTETQVYRGISALMDYLILHRKPTERDNYMSIDILTCENVGYYFDVYED